MKTKKKEETAYNPRIIESKIQKIWEDNRVYTPDLDRAKRPFYNLMMFPYPSAEGLHVGSVFTFTGADTFARFKRMQGYDVFEPMGLDGFGIHSENYALKVGKHPKEQAKISEKNFYRQLSSIGNGYDWSRKLETYTPSYYTWTQWIFIQLFKRGLAYRKKAPVNFCPSCKTVLADEQVIDGKCERCSSVVEKRELEQWFFKITDYAERLLKNIEGLNWTEKVKIAQREWIGKSEGMIFTARVKDSSLKIQTFSAHFEAFRADTFVVIAPDHPLLEELLKDSPKRKEVLDFCQKIIQGRKSKGYVGEKQIEGIFTEKYIVDPIGNGDLPIWVANYAVKEYGTGIVKCSAHDERDFAFAKKYGIRLKPVLFPKDPGHRKRVENLEECYSNMKEGYLYEPSDFVGKRAGDIREEIVKYLVNKGLAEPKNQYHLRDWLISRQRYWGPPIPMIFCERCASQKIGFFEDRGRKLDIESLNSRNQNIKDSRSKISNFQHQENPMHGWYPVPEDQLPVLLPDVADWRPEGSGTSPLANHPEFYKTTCPSCAGEARRETDVSDTFLDSAWYFFRYLSTDIESTAFDIKRAKKWLPVTMYIGGAEHSVLHLLYSRFITMVFKDMRLIDFEEPYARFYAHGLIIKDGAKMSKSKGNVINPDEYLKKYGADTLRAYLRFVGPFDKGGDFRDSGIEGMHKFLQRVRKLLNRLDYQESMSEQETKTMHKTIQGVTEDMEALRFNTAVAKLMTYYNFLSKKPEISKEEAETLLKLLAPIAPFLAEELYQRLCAANPKSEIRNPKIQSVHASAWPVVDKKYLVEDEITIVVQVDGKVRDTFRIQNAESRIQHAVEEKARESGKVKQYISGKNIAKVIYIEGKIINFVTE